MAEEPIDFSTVRAAIEVWFNVLSHLEPETDWSWDNPKLRVWMAEQGWYSRHQVPGEMLAAIAQTLERRYHSNRSGSSGLPLMLPK